MRGTAILFPGQGSLTPQSAQRAWDQWPELVRRAADLLGEDPFARAAQSTEFAQPAIFVASMAAWREDGPALSDVGAMAGHSLGELSALAAAGALDVDDALWLVALRGRLMARAAEANPAGGMLALLGVAAGEAASLAERHQVTLANDNAPGQIVVAGDRAALARLASEARAGGLRSLELDVAGAFHSPAMSAAEAPFLLALDDVATATPTVPVISGLTAQPFRDLPLELSQAIVSPVRWREVMGSLLALGASDFVDIGPGNVLARLVKRNVVARGANVVAA